jgi:hypothetical protein
MHDACWLHGCHVHASWLPCLLAAAAAGVRLDLVTACLEVLLPHTAAAAVQSCATPLLQPYGFVLQPGAAATSPSTGSSSHASTVSPAAAAAAASAATPLSTAAVAAAAAVDGEHGAGSSSYDELIKASSNPAALLGRLLENAPNLARVASSSRGSTGLSSLTSPAPSPVKQSPLKPSHLRPAAQQLPPLPASTSQSVQVLQQQQQQQDQVAISVAGPGQIAAAAVGAAAASSSSAAGADDGVAAAGGGLQGLPEAAVPASEEYKFSIEGMSCGSCVASVEAIVKQVRGWGYCEGY